MTTYVRLNNIEINGIPVVNEDANLEKNVTEILKTLDINVTSDDFEACHRLRIKDEDKKKGILPTTICRFVNRSICEKALRRRKNLAGKTINGFTNIYINENLSGFYKMLYAKCRRLKKRTLISDTWSFKGIPRIKLTDGEIKFITHEYDLEELFPNFVYFE